MSQVTDGKNLQSHNKPMLFTVGMKIVIPDI